MELKAKLSLALAFALAVTCVTGLAQNSASTPAKSPAQTDQQTKFGDCAKEAKAQGKKGDDYKAFMSSCASKNSAAPSAPATTTATAPAAAPALAPAKLSQQEKMKACNAEAKSKGLKGNDYTQFRNECLKGDAPASAH